MCPTCHTPHMFIKPAAKTTSGLRGRWLMIIGCSQCGLGEMLPNHPTWTAMDMYHFVKDYWRALKEIEKAKKMMRWDPHIIIPKLPDIPIFHYERLYEKVYNLLDENVTYGKIQCDNIMEDPKEEEDLDAVEEEDETDEESVSAQET